jgi:hypothetical protein
VPVYPYSRDPYSVRILRSVTDALLKEIQEGLEVAVRTIGPTVYRRLSAANPQSAFAKRAMTTVLRRMEQRGYITRTAHDQSVTFALTNAGRAKLDLATIQALSLPPQPARWDGQWRIVLFDVPEQKQLARTVFRRTLKRLGFKYLQRSVWVYPFPCEGLLTELAARLGIGEDVVIVVSRQLSNDRRVRQQFQLTSPSEHGVQESHHSSLVESGSRAQVIFPIPAVSQLETNQNTINLSDRTKSQTTPNEKSLFEVERETELLPLTEITE